MGHDGLVKRLHAALGVTAVTDIEDFKGGVEAVREGFYALPRHALPVSTLVSLKFQMQHWRQHCLHLLIGFLEKGSSNADAVTALNALALLELRPRSRERARIVRAAKMRQDREVLAAAATLAAFWGDHYALGALDDGARGDLAAIAGPRKRLPIVANAPSRMDFAKWSHFPQFSNYRYEGAGVVYRGISFLPGDILLSNVNRDGNGVYTALTEPRGYAYHLGVFAIFREGGRKLPVVLETYKLGVRAVPLSTFLSARFSSYVEVFRLCAKPEGFDEMLNAHAALLPSLVKGYNFDTEDPERDYVACTTLGTHLFELAGAASIRAKSRYIQEPRVAANLKLLDFSRPAFLSLSDYVVDEKLRLAGVVDNGHFDRNMTRELCERHFVEIFRRGRLSLRHLPVMFHLNRFGVRQMRAGTLLGKLIGFPYGLTVMNLPKGPEKVLALVEIYEHQLAAAVKHAEPLVRAFVEPGRLLDIDGLSASPEMSRLMKRELAAVARGFPLRLPAVPAESP